MSITTGREKRVKQGGIQWISRLRDASLTDADIEQRTGRSASRTAVLVTLERLEDKGLVTSHYGDPTPVRGNRRHLRSVVGAGRSGTRAAHRRCG